MSATSSEQAKTLFIAAMEHTPEQRRQFLDQTCGSDDALKQRVRQLLAAHEIADQVLPEPPGSSIGHSLDADPPRDVAGKRIGRYTLERVIAVGGMAVVYEARQENPVRSVALKVMKAAVASRSALRRFEFETQTLARLAHPNIARIHDAGLHDDPATPGDPVPYFAMELIPDARTLIEYANENGLRTRDRLELFIPVCDAVHHGHQKGVIHRDLKPSNILVDADGCPKIIDFGVARATDSDLTVTATHTDAGRVIGTVQYMSPEQAAGRIDDIDTRSDVYSLGVVAYELLAGKLPYDLRDRLIHEAVRIIQQDQPVTLGAINRTLRGDIETIVAKALEKDPARRYQSAADLARDIERYLAGEPIEAKRDSTGYVLRKHLRKHKLPVAVAAAFLTVVFAGLAASLTFWRQAVAQRDAAEAEHQRAEADFQKARDAVNQMLFEVGSKDLANVPQMETLRKTLLENAVTFYEGFLKDERADATVRYEAAQAYVKLGGINFRLGDTDEAEQAYRRAMILREALTERFPDELDYRRSIAVLHHAFANLHARDARHAAAESAYHKAVTGFEALVKIAPDDPENRNQLAQALNSFGVLLWTQNRLDEAETALRRSVALLEALVKEFPERAGYHSAIGGALNNIVLIYGQRMQNKRIDQPLDSRELLERAIVHQKAALELDPRHPDYRQYLRNHYANLAPELARAGDVEGAEQTLREVLRISEEQAVEFPDTPEFRFHVGRASGKLSDYLLTRERFEEAGDVSDTAVTVYEELSSEFPDVAKYRRELAFVHGNLARILSRLAAGEQAEQHSRQAIDVLQRLIDQNSATPQIKDNLAVIQLNLSDFAYKRGSYRDAEQALRQAHELWSELLTAFPNSKRYRHLLATASRRLAGFSLEAPDPTIVSPAEAVEFARQSVKLAPDDARGWKTLGALLCSAGDYPAAVGPLEKAIALRGDQPSAHEWFILAVTRWHLGEKEQARELYDRAVAWMKQNEPENESLRHHSTEAAQLLEIEDQ